MPYVSRRFLKENNAMREKISFILVAALFLSCAQKEGPHTKKAITVKGDVSAIVESKNITRTVVQGELLGNADIIRVPQDGYLEMTIGKDTVAVNGNSKINVSSSYRDQSIPVRAILGYGKAFFMIENLESTPKEFYVRSKYALGLSKKGCFSIEKNDRETTFRNLSGTLLVKDETGQEVKIGPGNNFVFYRDASRSLTYRISRAEIDALKKWAGQDRVARHMMDISKSSAPYFVSAPVSYCFVNTPYLYAAAAQDPDGGAIAYSLKEAPRGMKIDSLTGAVLWRPDTAGTFKVIVAAADNNNDSTEQAFSVRVKDPKAKGVVLASFALEPAIAKTGAKIIFNAQSSRGQGKLAFRWDFDGNGAWDSDFSNEPVITHVFDKSGVFMVKLEAKNDSGLVDSASGPVTINNPPEAKLSVFPESGDTATVFEIRAQDSVDPDNTALLYRFDINGDGKWDLPDSAGFTPDPRATYKYARNGNYKIIVEVKDAMTQTARASAMVAVNTLKNSAPASVSVPSVH